jgi:c-di-GMP-binding flagellar brake protein YcgR
LLWLDEPFGELPPLQEGQPLHLSVRNGYNVYSFVSSVVATVTGNLGQSVALLIPSELHLTPRRQARRYTLRGAPLPVKVRAPGNHSDSAQLINISCDGLRIALNGQHLARYKPGTRLSFCQFSLGPNISIRCQALIKAARLDKRHGRQTQVSLRFADIPPTQRQKIAAYLSRLDQLIYVSDVKAATAA